MHQSVRDIWTPFNEPLEARLNFMYLDVKGLVTTGLGNLIDATRAANRPPTDTERADSWVIARRLNWLAADGSVATDQQIDDEWDRTKARLDEAVQGGFHFGQYATIILPEDEIDRLVFGKLDEMEGFLRRRPPFAGFDGFPADAQLGILSMAWGMGPAFRFPKFQDFVAAGQWEKAATECRFNPDKGTIRTRNDRNQQLFRNAGLVVETGLDPANLLWSE
jgi:hypothetical protein